ncbi:MAG: ChaN family lipoprotein [Syntrophobacteraceae bacterium]
MGRWMLGVLAVCLVAVGMACSDGSGALNLWDVGDKRSVTLDEALSRLSTADVVTVGEVHDEARHHLAQLSIIKALHGSGQRLAVGLEMFQHRGQSSLDRWVAGQTSESEFKEVFSANWGLNWPLYRDIFLYCRRERIPMVGLNVPREITSKVAREGFGSLSPSEIGQLPPITCKVGREYADIMRRAHGHAGMSEAAFTRMCEAQLVWDTAMAVHAEEYLKANPGAHLVLLAGAVHAWKEGIPAQLKALNATRRVIAIVPESNDRFRKDSVTVSDADYLLP